MQEKYFKAKGLYYRVNNWQSNRLTLVFIHGLSGSSAAWVRYENHFKEKYNILSLDLRGHGKSQRPKKSDEYQADKFVEDIHDLLLYLKAENTVLICHSFGTLIVLEFLAKYQKMIKAVIFLSPNFNVKRRKLAQLIYPLFLSAKLVSYLPLKMNQGGHLDYQTNYLNTGDWNLRRMLADARVTGFRSYLYCLRYVYQINQENLLPKINIPVLLVHGKRDSVFPIENSYIMSKKIPDAKLIILQKADHIMVLNNFSEVSIEIADFINKIK